MWRGRHAAPIFYMEDNQVNWNNPDVSVATLPISNPNSAAAHEAGNFHEHMAYNSTAVDGDGGGLLGWLDGTNKQRQAQAFEMTMQERQWAYDDPSAQMERMKKAGINPNLAAGAIAGGNQSAGAPSSPVSAGNGAEAIGHIASAVGAVGGVANAAVGAIDTLSTLEGRKKLLFTQNAKMFEEMGFTKLQAQGYSIQLQYMDDKEKLGVAKMCCDIGEASQRISESKAHVKEIDQNISESKEREKLYRKQGNLADAEREKVQQEGYLLEKRNYQEQFRNDFIRNYSVDPNQPLVNQIAMAHLAGKNDTVEKLTGAVYNYNYNFYKGEYAADSDTIFQRSYNEMEGKLKATADNIYKAEIERLKADNDVKLHYFNRFSLMEASRERIVGMAHTIFGTDVTSIKSFIPWLIQSLLKSPTDVFNSFCRVYLDGPEPGLNNNLPN